MLKYVRQTTFYKRNSFFSRRNFHTHGQISSPFTAIIYKWGTIKTIIWIDKTNLRAHDLESLLEKTYEAGTKGRQISYKKEAQGFCDLSLEWNHFLSIKLVLFDVNIFVHFGYLIDSRSKFSNYWMNAQRGYFNGYYPATAKSANLACVAPG